MTSPVSAKTGHAVVIGASMGGLLAARALNDSYARVTIIDRDVLPTAIQPRRGIPQGRHLHILLARGRQALDELFPEFSEEITAAGAVMGDSQLHIRLYNGGRVLYPARSNLVALGASRPLIEHVVRTRVQALTGVEIIDRCEATGLISTTDHKQITGVRVFSNNTASNIEADFVVDAGGRGSHSLSWLTKLGYRAPEEEKISVNITYLTRHYQRELHHLGGDLGLGDGTYPNKLRGGYVLLQENNQFTVTLTGMLNEDPPADPADMATYADSLSTPDVAELIRTAVPVDAPAKMRYPASTRRRYERLDRFPCGYMVIGDALCSFNPVYGQGMTVAALEALLLQRLLANKTPKLAHRFFHEAAKLLNNPWSMATGSDLRFPQIQGKRTLAVRFLNAYLARFHIAAAHDPELGTAFLRVANLIDPPSKLLAPWIIRRVLSDGSREKKNLNHKPAQVR